MTSTPGSELPTGRAGLSRDMGLVALTATGIASMVGAGINVVPFMIQRNVPGIGAWVLPAFLCAAVPALFAGLAYAVLASAMPRAGGSYVYASRALNPYLGFIASFSQWFALCVAIGVVSYVLVPFLRDIALAAGAEGAAAGLESTLARLAIPLAVLWLFTLVNVLGIRSYERILVPLLGLTFVLGGIVIVAGFLFDEGDFARAVLQREGRSLAPRAAAAPTLRTFLTAATVLFSGFIGFDSIAQAGGEARNPSRTLPLAIGLAVLCASVFYMLFTAAVYHAVPWSYVADEAMRRDVNAPGLLGYVLPRGWTVAIVAGGAVALAKDVPAMLLGVSRLMFAWAEDGIFPRSVAALHPRHRTPHVAIIASAAMATVSVLGCHLAGNMFLGVDILVTAMLVNYILMCVSVLTLPHRNPALAAEVRVLPNRTAQVAVAVAGIVVLGGFLGMHTVKDLAAPVTAWYFRSTPVWALVMGVATVIFLREMSALRRRGVDVPAIFATLPPE
ncbi:MAG: APC family permease [Gemmatimonadaceae bacterium]|nr:APC family permease [Gemmatimonadaceae bacterium]